MATVPAGGNSVNVTFSSAYTTGTNVVVTLGVKDPINSPNNCLPTVANTTVSGFTLRWRSLNGNTCNVNGATSVNYFATPAK